MGTADPTPLNPVESRIMDKGIGFNRTIQLNWLDAAAAFCTETPDPVTLRRRLEPIVGEHLTGREARRKTIDVLLNIWFKSRELEANLHRQALDWFQTTIEPGDRLWLHYGLTMLYYSFFRECTTVIGQLSRADTPLTRPLVIKRMVSRLGDLGSLARSTQRVMSSLQNWGILIPAARSYTYLPRRRVLRASQRDLEIWLLTCALKAHPVEELHFDDLLNLPALFPFYFTLSAHDLRRAPQLEIQRQGLGFEMVRLG
jgi:hypothetical protein